MPRKYDPAHVSLALSEWPTSAQHAWQGARRKGDVFDAGGGASHWRETTAKGVLRSVGHWFAWRMLNTEYDAGGPVERDVTPENIERYVHSQKSRCASSSVTCRIRELYMGMKVMAPGVDWLWLRSIWYALQRRTIPAHDKRSRLASVSELLACGVEAMRAADADSSGRLFERAMFYRDGLMVAILASRPIRLKNLAEIELGKHLVRRGTTYWLYFRATETKTGYPLEPPFPEELVPFLQRYVEVYRPLFGQNSVRDPRHARHLWLSTRGRGLSSVMVYRRIVRLTKERLGHAISPHDFRTAAGTSIAFEAPEKVLITRDILGHSTMRTSESYYNLAQSLEASRRYHAHVDTLRRGGRDGGGGVNSEITDGGKA